ncbi:MAG: hypothetical protein BZ135_08060 [Methanosphaera sp. rholeuAM6]|nr:MAG: hypothetical protein BZ135_08060 [Methanosphaera sp. rholeuAM6]
MYKFSLGCGNTEVDYELSQMGKDYRISITGGMIHIGGVALVSMGNYDLLSVENHKEYEIIEPLAQKLTKYTENTFLIVAGIHVDNITLNEIKEIIENNKIAIAMIDDYFSLRR